jgi:hypothetical protein
MKSTYNHFSVKELFGGASSSIIVETVLGGLPNKSYNSTAMNAKLGGTCIRTWPPQVLDLMWVIEFFWIYSRYVLVNNEESILTSLISKSAGSTCLSKVLIEVLVVTSSISKFVSSVIAINDFRESNNVMICQNIIIL